MIADCVPFYVVAVIVAMNSAIRISFNFIELEKISSNMALSEEGS